MWQPPDKGSNQPAQAIRSGVDLVPVARLVRLIGETPEIAATIFTARELAYCAGKRRRHEHLAARFAAKEAVLKAFGTGLGQGMRWTDVEVVNARSGRPQVVLHGKVAALALAQGLVDLDLSLSHTAELAIAQVVAVWQQHPPMQSKIPAEVEDET